MIKSMTGFASITHENDMGVIGVTIRAVNHRYLDLQLRAPASMSEREPALRAAVQRRQRDRAAARDGALRARR